MALQIQETFQVQASVERVWAYLIDPHQVVQCLPGAELLEVQDARTFVGQVKVKIGPVTTAYRGRAQLVEVDEASHRVSMVGEGQETSGSGSARMTMASAISALPGGGCEVRVQVEMDVVGRIVQFGRGMIEEVSRQLFRQFASCVQATLGQEAAATAVSHDAPAAAAPVAEGADGAAPAAAPTVVAAAAAAEKAPVNGLQLILQAILGWSRRVLSLQRKQR